MTEGMADPVGMSADVIVVGGGPVGAMLANLLGMQGVATVVVERERQIYDLPRAVHFDDEIMRLLQTIGLSGRMDGITHPVPGTRFVDDAGRLLLDWSRSGEVGPQGFHVSYRFHQPEFEAVLREGLARWPSVTVRTGCEVLGVEQSADSVRVTVRHDDGQVEVARTRYVVGCDGARSPVRQWIGGDLEDLGFRERWLVVDALLLRPRPDLGEHSLQHCSTVRPATYIRGLGNRRRWEITVFPGEDADELTKPEAVYGLLRRWVTPEDATLERAVVYTFHSALAERWRDGRLLIAGDAAHLMPPFLGQGLCSGMRDVANLAWKLPLVLRDPGKGGLLDSYQSERAPHVRQYIDLSVQLGGLINTKAMSAAVSEETLRGGEPRRMTSIRPSLGPGLGDGSPLRGSLSPQPRLRDGRLLDDVVGFRPALVVLPGAAAEGGQALRDAAQANGVGLVIDDSPAAVAWLESNGIVAALIRPDRYVAGTATDGRQLPALVELARWNAWARTEQDAGVAGFACNAQS